jgi:hypothetical protein
MAYYLDKLKKPLQKNAAHENLMDLFFIPFYHY